MSFGFEVFQFLIAALVVVALVIVWVGGNALSTGTGGTVDRTNRVAQLYGYTVCLVSIITVLFTVPNLISNLFRLSDPLQADSGFEPALTSFDAYRATWDRQEAFGPRTEAAPPRPVPSESEMRRSYEALREDHISRNRFEARRSLVSSSLLLALAIGFFVGHWRWLRRRSESTGASS